jgi:hypothetical protein
VLIAKLIEAGGMGVMPSARWEKVADAVLALTTKAQENMRARCAAEVELFDLPRCDIAANIRDIEPRDVTP